MIEVPIAVFWVVVVVAVVVLPLAGWGFGDIMAGDVNATDLQKYRRELKRLERKAAALRKELG